MFPLRENISTCKMIAFARTMLKMCQGKGELHHNLYKGGELHHNSMPCTNVTPVNLCVGSRLQVLYRFSYKQS